MTREAVPRVPLPARITRRWKIWAAALAVVAAGAVLALYAAAGFFDSNPFHLFGMNGPRKPVAALFFSGDMGLRFGMGPHVAAALIGAGVPVLGVSSPTAFAAHRSRAETNAIFADAVRDTLARTGAKRIVVIGQSFGADMVRVGLVSLPADLRKRVAAVVLVVPGKTAYFRADPSELSYRGPPDAGPAEAARLDWVPLVCIRGALEPDSLCLGLTTANVRRIVLPGGHFLRNDHQLLVRTIFGALGPLLPRAEKQ